MTKRLLLTGAGGSIGCHTLAYVLDHTDWNVICVDSFRHKGMPDRIVQVLNDPSHNVWRRWSRVKLLTHDLTSPLSPITMRSIGAIDHIIAMASLSDVHASLVDPVPFVTNNVAVALNLLEYARAAQPETFLLVSTDEVYGPTDGVSTHKEWSSVLPSNPYSASKAAQEALGIAWWRAYGIPLVIVNLMNNFGEMQSPAKFPAIVQRKVRAGETVDIHAQDGVVGSRWYIHSRNTADALLFLLQRGQVTKHAEGTLDRPDRYNIVGDRQLKNDELALMIANIVGKPLKHRIVPASTSRPGHDVHYGLDGGKLAALGWRSPTSLEDSLRQTVEWYERHPEWLL